MLHQRFSFYSYKKPGIIVPVDGSLVILNGQTVSIAEGSVKQYSSIQIDAGGTLQITGTTGSWTEIGCSGNCVVNGQIIARAGYDGEASHSGGTFTKASSAFGFGLLSYTITQRNGGAGGVGYGAALTQGLGGAQSLGRGGGGGGAGNSVKAGNGGAGGASGQGVTKLVSGKFGSGTQTVSVGGTGTGVINGGSGSINGGNGAGGGGGGSEWSESIAVFKGGTTYAVTGGGGGGSGYRGHHGKGLTLYIEGILSGSGLIACSGRSGFTGGAGGPSTSSPSGVNYRLGGGGGGGSGGSGGKLLVKYGDIGPNISFSVAGGSSGAGGSGNAVGSNGVAGDIGALTLTKIV